MTFKHYVIDFGISTLAGFLAALATTIFMWLLAAIVIFIGFNVNISMPIIYYGTLIVWAVLVIYVWDYLQKKWYIMLCNKFSHSPE